jgi:DNA-directed RNA polymerase subunit RPC12/RpoP
MAEATRYVCSACRRAIEAWSDGNPYYIDERGRKQYAYHPDHKALDRCVGNDSPHICLACGEEFNVDSRAPVAECPKCMAGDIAECFQLSGKRCPYCKAGDFAANPDYYCIS